MELDISGEGIIFSDDDFEIEDQEEENAFLCLKYLKEFLIERRLNIDAETITLESLLECINQIENFQGIFLKFLEHFNLMEMKVKSLVNLIINRNEDWWRKRLEDVKFDFRNGSLTVDNEFFTKLRIFSIIHKLDANREIIKDIVNTLENCLNSPLFDENEDLNEINPKFMTSRNLRRILIKSNISINRNEMKWLFTMFKTDDKKDQNNDANLINIIELIHLLRNPEILKYHLPSTQINNLENIVEKPKPMTLDEETKELIFFLENEIRLKNEKLKLFSCCNNELRKRLDKMKQENFFLIKKLEIYESQK